MKIVICGSMSAAKKMVELKKQLEEKRHSILLPQHSEEFATGEKSEKTKEESAQNKIEGDLIRDYYNKIAKADAILVANEEKSGIESYVGGNSFLEMGFAHVLGKEIFLLNGIPETSYQSEIVAMQPICLKGDLDLIK